MKPIGWIGVVLIAVGIIALATGITYTADRQTVEVGPVELTAERKATVPPIVGVLVLGAGIALVFAGRERT